MANKTYDPDQAPTWCKNITEAVKERVKQLGMERYKVLLTINASRWNEKTKFLTKQFLTFMFTSSGKSILD